VLKSYFYLVCFDYSSLSTWYNIDDIKAADKFSRRGFTENIWGQKSRRRVASAESVRVEAPSVVLSQPIKSYGERHALPQLGLETHFGVC